MFWVHCNRCGLFMEEAMSKGQNKAFHLTNCGHIFCADCSDQATNLKCAVCSAPEVRTVQLESGMKSEIKSSFADLNVMSKSLAQALEYQQSQSKLVFTLFRKNMAALGNHLRYTCTLKIGSLNVSNILI